MTTASLELGDGISLFVSEVPEASDGRVLLAIYGKWSHQSAFLTPAEVAKLVAVLQEHIVRPPPTSP